MSYQGNYPFATASGQLFPLGQGDVRYGRLSEKNTWLDTQTLQKDLVVGAATDGYSVRLGETNSGIKKIATGQFNFVSAGTDILEIRNEYSNFRNQLRVYGNEVFHRGNMGPNSGLDADTLDGIQADQFMRSDTNELFTAGTLTFTQPGGGLVFNTSSTNTGNDYAGIRFNNSTGNNGELELWTADDRIEDMVFRQYTDESGKNNPVEIFRASNSGVTFKGLTVWHSGNDGSGSGLDADLLDNLNSTQFLRSDVNTTANGILTAAKGIVIPANGKGIELSTSGQNLRFINTVNTEIWGVWQNPNGAQWYGTITSNNDLTFDTQTGAGKFLIQSSRDATLSVLSQDNAGQAFLNVMGTGARGTGRIFVGSNTTGGGLIYDEDDGGREPGAGDRQFALYRVSNGSHSWTARNDYRNDYWEFKDYVRILNQGRVLTTTDTGAGKGLDADTVDGSHLASSVANGTIPETNRVNTWTESQLTKLAADLDYHNALRLEASGITPASTTVDTGYVIQLGPVSSTTFLSGTIHKSKTGTSTWAGTTFKVVFAGDKCTVVGDGVGDNGVSEFFRVVRYTVGGSDYIGLSTKTTTYRGAFFFTGYTTHTSGLKCLNPADLGTLTVQGPLGTTDIRATLRVMSNLVWHEGNDGAGSTLDADLLDGQQGVFYQNASNLNAGTLPAARLSGNYSFAGLTLSSTLSVGSDVTVTGPLRQNGNVLANGDQNHFRRGILGGYSSTSGDGSNWGAPIWSIGADWNGTGYGPNFAITSGQYGLTWLRESHSGADSFVKEGLYLYRSGTNIAAFGYGGAKINTSLVVNGGIQVNNAGGFGLYINGVNSNTVVWKANAGSTPTSTNLGFTLTYEGSGTGNNNALSLSSASTLVYRVLQNGVMTFNKVPLVGTDNVWTSGNDGSGSGLDADLLDGQHGSFYQNASNINAGALPNARLVGDYSFSNLGLSGSLVAGSISIAQAVASNQTEVSKHLALFKNSYGLGVTDNTLNIVANDGNGIISLQASSANLKGNVVWHAGNDGAGSGLDADLLDGQHGSFYQNASNLNSGLIPDARLEGNRNVSGVWTFGPKMALSYRSADAETVSWQVTDTEAIFNYTESGEGDGANPGYPWIFRHTVAGNSQDTFVFDRLGSIKYLNNVVWHAGNDGSGSGLDADLLDGLQGSQFLRNDTNGTLNGILTVNMSSSATIRFATPSASTALEFAKTNEPTVTLKKQTEGFIIDGGTNSYLNLSSNDGGESAIQLSGNNQGTGRLFVGQSSNLGGGILYDGDGTPNVIDGGSQDYLVLYRGGGAPYTWTARNHYQSNAWEFRDYPTVAGQGRVLTTTETGLELAGMKLRAGSNNYRNINTLINQYFSNTSGPSFIEGAWAGALVFASDGNSSEEGFAFVQKPSGSDSPDSNYDTMVLELSAARFKYLNNTVWHAGNDGAGSTLDADLLDGLQGVDYVGRDREEQISATKTLTHRTPFHYGAFDQTNIVYFAYAAGDNFLSVERKNTNDYVLKVNNQSVVWHAGNDGAGSTLDADLLDGQQGSFYQNATNLTTGTLPTSRLSGTYSFTSLTLSSTATAANVNVANNIRVNNSVTGGYNDSGGTGTGNGWGCSIWSMGSAYTGSVGGSSFTLSNNQYGLVWLRASHASAIVGEGQYNYQGGGLVSAFGTSGSVFRGGVSIISSSAGSSQTDVSKGIAFGSAAAGFGIGITSNTVNIVSSNGDGVVSLQAASANLKGNTIWHAGNDGAGSGLDADTVDGNHYDDIFRKIMDSTYPVDSVVWSTSSTNPASKYNMPWSTWERYARGRVLVSEGNSDVVYGAGQEGGQSRVALSISEMPRHRHQFNSNNTAGNNPQPDVVRNDTNGNPDNVSYTSYEGLGYAHENRMPYRVAYAWVRTA